MCLNERGIEAFDCARDERQMPHIGWTKAQVFLKRDGEEGAWKLERAGIARVFEGDGAIAGANGEESQIAPFRKSFEVATGMSNAVDLVKRVREVGDSRRLRDHSFGLEAHQLSCSPKARRSWAASLHARRSPPETGPLPSICTALMIQ